jgi:NAD(P)H-hydrate epimerase
MDITYIRTQEDVEEIQKIVKASFVPARSSHKGQNGKVFIIGGSTLFHAASLWAAEIATHFTDMVHYSSTLENIEVFLRLKTIFRNGIIVHKKDIPYYVEEDDAVLIGPGMVRKDGQKKEKNPSEFAEIISLTDEAEYSRELTFFLLHHYQNKRFVLDAGALQMMDPKWLTGRREKVIITPHQLEFKTLFGEDIATLPTIEKKAELVARYAYKYECVIMLKAVDDIITDGKKIFIVQGGNQGLTKGGTGDLLAGLTVSFLAKNDQVTSCLLASIIEKKTAEELSGTKGFWYNTGDLIEKIPEIFTKLHYN